MESNMTSKLLDLPVECRARLVQLFSPTERLALFKCSHAAARIVLQHAPRTKLTPAPYVRRLENETKAEAARRHHVAMCLAKGSKNLELCLLNETLTAIPDCIHSSITSLELNAFYNDAPTLMDLCLEQLENLHTIAFKRCRALLDGATVFDDGTRLQLHGPITLSSEVNDLKCLLQIGSLVGHAVDALHLSIYLQVTASELESLAAIYPAVTKLSIHQRGALPDDAMEFILHQWDTVQQLSITT